MSRATIVVGVLLVLVLVGVLAVFFGGSPEHHGARRRVPGATVLVIYYSRSGNTAAVAEAIADQLGADVEPLSDVTDRGRGVGFLRSLVDIIRQTPASLEPLQVDPSTYQLVLVGTPVWGNSTSTPVRAFFERTKGSLVAVGFFITDGLTSHDIVFKDMADRAGKQPVATLGIAGADVQEGRFAQPVQTFVAAVKTSLR